MLIILAIFLIFGPDRIPEMARNLGKFINEIKRASEDIKTEINKEADKKERERRLREYEERLEHEKKKVTVDAPETAVPRKSSATTKEEAGKAKKEDDETLETQ